MQNETEILTQTQALVTIQKALRKSSIESQLLDDGHRLVILLPRATPQIVESFKSTGSATREPRGPSQTLDAVNWLEQYFIEFDAKGDGIPSEYLFEQAAAKGINRKALYTASKMLHIHKSPTSDASGRYWLWWRPKKKVKLSEESEKGPNFDTPLPTHFSQEEPQKQSI